MATARSLQHPGPSPEISGSTTDEEVTAMEKKVVDNDPQGKDTEPTPLVEITIKF